MANDLLRVRFEPYRDLAMTAALALSADRPALMLHRLKKSCVYVARYLRQSIVWVEALSLEELNGWIDVLSEVLIEERGGKPDQDGARDPFGFLVGDD